MSSTPLATDGGDTTAPGATDSSAPDASEATAPDASSDAPSYADAPAQYDGAADAAQSEGVASVTGTVAGHSIDPAYAYEEYGIIIVSNDPAPAACDGTAATTALSLQLIGWDGGVGTYESGSSLLVSIFLGAGTCHDTLLLGAGSVVLNSSSPALEGTFSANFDGGTLVGSFTAPPSTGCSHLPMCDGG